MTGSRRRIVLGVTLALFVAALGVSQRVELVDDISLLLPDGDPDVARLSVVTRAMMERTVVDIGLPDDVAAASGIARLAAAADDFARRVTSDLTQVRTRVPTADAIGAAEVLRVRAPMLLPDATLEGLDERVTDDAVLAAVERLARRIAEPDGAWAAATAATDPLGLGGEALAGLGVAASGLHGAQVVDGRLLSEDGRHLLVFVETGVSASDTPAARVFVGTLLDAARAVEQEHGVRVAVMGVHRASLDNRDMIVGDVAVASTITVLAVGLLALLCMGRVWLALAAMFPAAVGGVLAFGVLGLVAPRMAVAVLGFGAVLLGLAIDFGVHVLRRLDRDGSGARLPVRPLLMGATTTAVAFATLNASSMPGLRDIGSFGVLGILAAAAVALLVLPALPLGPGGRSPVLDLERWMSWSPRTARRVALAAVLITPLLLPGACLLRRDADVRALSGVSAATRADERAIEAAWGKAFHITSLVVEGQDLEQALRRNEELAAWLDAPGSDGPPLEHASIAGLLPARATQQQRAQRWRAFWTAERREQMGTALARAEDATPFRAGAFAPFLAGLDSPLPGPLQLQDLQGPLAELVATRVIEAEHGWLVVTPVFAEGVEAVEALSVRLTAELPDVTLLDREAFMRKLDSLVTGEMVGLGGWALLLVGGVLLLWTMRVELTVLFLVPLLLALGWTLGLLGWLGVPLNLVNAVFVVFLFGVAADYAVFLAASHVDRLRDGRDRTAEARASVALCTVTSVAGFGALAVAEHPVLHGIGVTALVGLLAAGVATQALVPALMGVLLVRGGPNGTPGLRHALTALWVYGIYIVGSLRQRWRRTRGEDPAARERQNIEAIHAMGLRIRHDLPIGRREYLGEELLDSSRACVLVANHESLYDIGAVTALPLPIHVMVKRWVWNAPVMGAAARAAGYVLAEGHTVEDVLADAKSSLARGVSVLVFPEGTRSRKGRLRRFHRGAFTLAREAGVPLQPVALVNTREVVPADAWWVGDHHARIVVLPRVEPEEFGTGPQADRQLAREVRERIRAARDEHWLATQRSRDWWRTLAGMYRYLGPLVWMRARWQARRDALLSEIIEPSLSGGTGPVLVVGAGLGLLAARLALAAPERPIAIVDRDARALATARAALGSRFEVTFIEGDVRDLADEALAPHGPPSLITLVDAVQRWPAEDRPGVLERLASLAGPETRLLFRDAVGGCSSAAWTTLEARPDLSLRDAVTLVCERR